MKFLGKQNQLVLKNLSDSVQNQLKELSQKFKKFDLVSFINKSFQSEKLWVNWKNNNCPKIILPDDDLNEKDMVLKKKQLSDEMINQREKYVK